VVQFIKQSKVQELTSLSQRSIDRLVREDKFPKPIWIAEGRKAWVLSEVLAWINEKMAAAS
jgi:prophage regulatory protein